MGNFAIRAENLGKLYQLGVRRWRHDTLRDHLAHSVKSLFSRNGHDSGRSNGQPSQIWALKDVSFDVKHGEVVGFVGRNGAGKSTLLKILSRITEPTKGRAEIYGRVGSLLEVGTGFHPELTGRENIFLNGAILGMRKAEIERKFDEIVAFSEIETFLDTAVKHYSSGMYVRLAFAVAVHLEPEILIVDEVLAVGDAQFQKKCFEKMREIQRGNRTILLVSHNMSAIRNICQHAIILKEGQIIGQGAVDDVVDKYLEEESPTPVGGYMLETDNFVLKDVRIYSRSKSIIKTFDPVEIRVRLFAKTKIVDPGLYIGILSSQNERLMGLDFKDFQTVPTIPAGQQYEMGFLVKSLPLLHGRYQIEVHLKDMSRQRIEVVPRTFSFEVVETPVYGGRKLDAWFGHIGLEAQALYSDSL